MQISLDKKKLVKEYLANIKTDKSGAADDTYPWGIKDFD